MRKVGCTFILILYNSYSFSQKVQVLNPSGYTHDYVVGSLEFIEDPTDTPQLKYIATLNLIGEQTNLLVIAQWYELIKIKAKSLGANSFLVESYNEDTNVVSLNIRVYFSGESFLKKNRLKAITNSIFVFNQTRFDRDTGSFYLNDKKVMFDTKKFSSTFCEINKPYYLATGESNITATKIVYKKIKPSIFFIVPANKKTFVVNRSKLNPNSKGLVIYGVDVNFGRNSAYKLDYQTGRMLMEVYK
jgi:hypothetical protein